jgi:hypothetical protein
MSFVDSLAAKAIQMGKSSSEFSAAAQRHANATWLYLIAGAIVWFFFGWAWALIPFALAAFKASQSISSTLVAGRLEKGERGRTAANNIEAIVQAYAKVLEHSAPTPGCVADVSKLPFPKDMIKAALIAAMKLTGDKNTKEALKVGYVQLSSWQKNVGETDQGIDTLNMDLSQDTKALAELVLKQSEGAEKWLSVMEQDEVDLQRELVELGLW